ncbi:MAG: hypothetical protein ACK56W_05655 [Pirellula sp.]|nr:hypothetical protein [Pirellula sp.]
MKTLRILLLSACCFGCWTMSARVPALHGITAIPAPPGAIPAPPGKCWNYSPTYCDLLEQSGCSGEVVPEDLANCVTVGSSCGSGRRTNNDTEPELIARATADVSPGYLYKILGESTEVVCGEVISCRYVLESENMDGVRRLKCSDDGYAGDWFFQIQPLEDNCTPATNVIKLPIETPEWEG